MSKYITHFQTEAAYQAALPTLDLPNVSLVDELGEVHYHRALYNAKAGDICLYDVAEGQKIFVASADWNLTDYPTASYPIVGIAVKNEDTTGVILCSALELKNDGDWSSGAQVSWAKTYFSFGQTLYNSTTEAVTDLNGKANTASIISAIEAYDQANSTDNITGCIGYAIRNCFTPGTNKGDWYIPSAGEIYNIGVNFTEINTTLNKIKTANSSLANDIIIDKYYPSSTENSSQFMWFLRNSSGSAANYLSSSWKQVAQYARPFYKINS